MTDSDKKKGMVMVISVGGKPPKSPEDTSKPDVKKAKMCPCGSGKPQAKCCPDMKKAPIPEATAPMGQKPPQSGFGASEEGKALAEAPREKPDYRQLDRHGDEIKPGPVSAATQDLQMRTEPTGSPLTQEMQLLDALNQSAVRDSHQNPILPNEPGVDPPMPEVSHADEGAVAPPRRKPFSPPFLSPNLREPRPVVGAPSTVTDFKEGRPPKDIFARSFDGPLNHAWSLLKFVNKKKYAQMAPDDPDSQPGGVYDSPSEEEENEEDQPTTSLEHLLQLLGENPDLYDDHDFGSSLGDLVQNERPSARGLSNLQDPFRMKRPEMADEMLDMSEEEARRDSPISVPAEDWHMRYALEGGEDEGEMPQFSMDKPEMGKRRQDLQSEIARRGKPALDE